MDTKGVENHLHMAKRVAQRGFETFEFHNIISNTTPAPRFNNSSTNILELIAWIMKSNGSRWCTVPQFVRQYIHLYNYPILQMKQDYLWFQNLTLTSIGYSIMRSHTTELQKIDVPTFTLMTPKMKHNMTKGRTYLTATLSLDQKVADTHEAELSW